MILAKFNRRIVKKTNCVRPNYKLYVPTFYGSEEKCKYEVNFNQ